MHEVKQTEQPRMMDQPVHPVEIGIMHHTHQRKSSEKVPPSMERDIAVKRRMRPQVRLVQQDDWRQRKNDDRYGREDQFTPVIPIARIAALYLLPKDAPPEQYIEDQESDTGNYVIFIGDIPEFA